MRPSPHEAEFSFVYRNKTIAERIVRSIDPETADLADERSRTHIEQTGDRVTIAIDAADVVALRAALNTWLTLVAVSEKAIAASESDDIAT